MKNLFGHSASLFLSVCFILLFSQSVTSTVAQGIPLPTPLPTDPQEGIFIESQPSVDENGSIISRESDLAAAGEIREISKLTIGRSPSRSRFPKSTPGDITSDTLKLGPDEIEAGTPPLPEDVKPLGGSVPEEMGGINADPDLPDLAIDGNVEPSAIDNWYRVRYEGFEADWPSAGWRASDNDGYTNGQVFWDDDDYKPFRGGWSAWAANGGANGLDPYYYFYRNNMRSWMVYGPFDLTNSTDAELLFYFWNQSELNYDHFNWLASTNGTNFYGYRTSGDSLGWKYVNFDLRSVPYLGNVTGDSSVWIAFVFNSDVSVVDDGPFVDEVTLQKYIPASDCPGQMKAQYYPNTNLSGNPTFLRCESSPINQNWGSGGPGSGVGSDNFSARWTKRAYFNSGTYIFKVKADDGIRLWLDGTLLIPGWYDQAPKEYIRIKRVSVGYHDIRIEYYERGGGAMVQADWYLAPSPVQYTERDGFHTFTVDLWNPNVSVETVMAQDISSGNSTSRERVSQMVARAPYSGRNPVLAFNADYFGNNSDGTPHHGAQGLTVKNGIRLPNAGTHNGDEWRRSSLSIPSYSTTAYPSRTVRIGLQTDCSGPPNNNCTNWSPDPNKYYNTVGGGPLFVSNAQRIDGSGSTQPCTNENFENRYCDTTTPTKWTAAGVSADGRFLYVIVTKVGQIKTMDQAAATLISMGASRAIKLDGGGSTQVWYRDNSNARVYGDRSIANAMLVFVQP